jgi:uncharacterized membrane protein YdbT with pleckstrin-like domain
LLSVYAYSGKSGAGSTSSIGNPSGIILAAVGILSVLAATAIISGIVRRNATEMAVTNKRVVVKTGIASRRTFEMLLSKIESIGVEESVMGRMFGYGTVIIRGTGGTPDSFPKISHPLEFRRQVQQHIEIYQQQSPAAAPPLSS